MKKEIKKKTNKKGITLIELLVVVAIITILAAILLPYVGNRAEDAKIAAMEEMINSLRSATTLMYNDASLYPTQWIHFVSPVNPPYTAGVNWKGPYLNKSDTAASATWVQGSPWKTDLVLFTNNNATQERFADFAGNNLFPFRYAIALQVVNPATATTPPTIPLSSLQRIDSDLDNGANNSGYIVYTSTATTPIITAGSLTFQAYNSNPTVNTYFDILINAIP